MTSVQVKSAGVSLRYPSTWTVVPVTKRGVAAMLKSASKGHPKLAKLLANLDVSRFKFFAINLPGAAGAHRNVNVVLDAAVHGTTLADVRDGFGPLLKADGSTLVDIKKVKVSGKSAFRVDNTFPVKGADGTITDWYQGTLVIPGATSGTEVSVTASDDGPGTALINTMLTSVRHI